MSTAVAVAPAKVAKKVNQCLEELKAMEYFNNKPERLGSPSLGDVVRQGDIYLTCIDKLPTGSKVESRQLAEGDTQGSRHILVGDVSIVKPTSFGTINSVLVGPAFECVGETTLQHPEHGWKILPAGTCWQTTFQLAFAEEVRRVRD